MYSKQEASILNQQFWTSFGQYMAPVLNAEGEKINWVNYKTGVKNVRFVLTADNKVAKISLELSHKDTASQKQDFEKFLQLRRLFEKIMNEKWQWEQAVKDEYGKTISLIYTTLNNVNVFEKSDWPSIISFFKTRMIALDRFWCENKFAFEK